MKTEKLLDIIKAKDIVIPSHLFKIYKKLNITEKELIFISYIINSDKSFDPESLSREFNWDLIEIMEVVSNLSEKKLLDLTVKKQDGKLKECFDLNNLYEKVLLNIIDEETEEIVEDNSKIYNLIETEFGRPLSPIECETISGWLNSNISEELIKEALKEAVLSGVNKLKYIDAILFDWTKKGYKKVSDIKKKKRKEKKQEELFEYDWLDEKV